MASGVFSGRRLVLATMHGKEQAIVPVLKEVCDCDIFVPSGFNTDCYGTFSGEIERACDPLETARMKCRDACAKYDCSLAIASEGSFGPHPYMPFAPADDEILVLLDLENNLEIKVRELTAATNFNGALLKSWEEAKAFAGSVLFPSHGLIARNEPGGSEYLCKGISNWEALQRLVPGVIEKYGQVFLETDMRAMYNPTRMATIGKAARKLADAMLRTCPRCNIPGFDIAEVMEGLPCELCGQPTKSTLLHVYSCQKCSCRQEKMYPNGKQKESPMYCDWCNP